MRTTARSTALVGADARASQDKYYVGLDDSTAAYRRVLEGLATGDRVIELGCGIDGVAFDLAARGVDVLCIDPSVVVVEAARRAALERGLLCISHRQMSVEELDLSDDSFDAVIGAAVLHNLDIELVFAEIARVLKPSGFAVLLEPLGHNPVINAYRRRTPRSRDAFAHPLRFEDLSLARRWFARVDLRSFHVLAMLAGPVADRPGGRRLSRALHAIDRVLIDRIPGMRRYAWLAVVELGEPR